MMSICLMMFGVYAASNPSVSISGQVSYSVRDAKVLVLGKVNGQAGDDSNVDYPAVADATNPTESAVSLPAQYLGYTKGESANDSDDNFPQWNMGTTAHAFYEDSTGIRPIKISFMLRNLSNYPVVATVDFTGVTDANLASKNLTRETTGMTDDNKVYLDKGRAKEISITYAVANDAQGVNGNNLLDMNITFEKTVFPETMKGEVQIDGQTINQSDWVYSFDGDSFTIVKFVGDFPEKVNEESTLEIPSQVKCEDGTVYPIKTIGTLTEYDFMKEMKENNVQLIFDYFAIVDSNKLFINGDLDAGISEEYFYTIPSNIVIPEGIEKINAAALVYAIGVENLPNSVKEIGGYGCVETSIATLDLPNLTKVGAAAFFGVSLSTVYIEQEDPTKIFVDEAAFGDITSALKIIVPNDNYRSNENWASYKDCLYSENYFGNWKVELDKANATADIIAYDGDITRTEIFVPGEVPFKDKTYHTRRVGKQWKETGTILDIPSEKLEDYVLFKCVVDGVQPSVKKIVFEDGVQEIGACAFYGIYGEKDKKLNVTFPNTLVSIGEYAFFMAGNFESIIIPDSVIIIEGAAFFATYVTNQTDCFKLSNSLKEIGTIAFAWTNLPSVVTIPASVETIGNSAFADSYEVENFIFEAGSKLRVIEEGAFGNFEAPGGKLKSITIPASVESIGEQAFYQQPSLTSVTFESENPPKLYDQSIFDSCSKLVAIYVPSASLELYKNADGWKEYADKIQAIV